jgi:chorismate synthase
VLDKFGGDSLAETRRNVESYLQAVAERMPAESPVRASG